VDKTGFALDMVERGSHYFLSRPRRFGKSLLIDTFKELFEGNQALFTGLIAEPRSTPFTPALPTTGTAKANWQALRATTPASSTATLMCWASTSAWKTRATLAAST
jgi:hypothetical protein